MSVDLLVHMTRASLTDFSRASISECGRYRYMLERSWDTRQPILAWCMLNPSTADHETDDPTIRKCVGFSRRWGYGGIVVVNLCAYRATDPRELKKCESPVGPLNVSHVVSHFASGGVVAWGNSVPKRGLAYRVISEIRHIATVSLVWSLGLTKHGQPRHPLMLPYTTERQQWK